MFEKGRADAEIVTPPEPHLNTNPLKNRNKIGLSPCGKRLFVQCYFFLTMVLTLFMDGSYMAVIDGERCWQVHQRAVKFSLV